jgi:hypothetical protein
VVAYGAAACGGKLYRVGGSYQATWVRGEHGAEVYDPATDTWTSLPPMIHGHAWPGLACLDGKLYVAGGLDDDKVSAKAAEVYDIAGGYWDDEAMADLPLNWWGSADFLLEDMLFLAGGRFAGEERAATFVHDLYYYPWSDYWIIGPVLQEPRFRMEGDSAGGVGYVLGGWGDMWAAHDSTEILLPCAYPMHVQNIAMDSWSFWGWQFVMAEVLVHDAAGNPVSGATVSAQWTLPGGSHQNQQGTTYSQGTVMFTVLSREKGTYQLCVTDVEAQGYFYDWTNNIETCDTDQAP